MKEGGPFESNTIMWNNLNTMEENIGSELEKKIAKLLFDPVSFLLDL